MEKLKNLAQEISANLFEKLFSSWFFAAIISLFITSGEIALNFGNAMHFCVLFAVSFILICCIQTKYKKAVFPILAMSALGFSVCLLMRNDSIYTFAALAVVYFLAVYHFYNKTGGFSLSFSNRQTVIFTVIAFVLFFGTVTAVSVLRYVTYNAPNYDFGIFCNMYHNMKHTFLPTASCERDKILSHFAVHFSPALYVFLPIYFIFPSPVTVAVCQTLAIYSAVIPFILILRHRKFSSSSTVLLSVMFLASTAFAKGCAFDFHENCLLPLFLMWMFFFYEKKKTVPFFIFAILTLMVKEDAFIYIAVFAVYIFLADKQYKKGSILLFIGAAYFLSACAYLENFGTGIMSNRYDAMISGDEGLFGIIKTVFTNPGYTFGKVFGTTDDSPEKVIYFLQLMCPLAFLPFMTKKPVRFILILPVLLNLLTDYSYQYNITFQYSFGITSLLLYACILNASDMPEKRKSFTSALASGLAVMMFVMLMTPSLTEYTNDYIQQKEIIEEFDEILDKIPEDASVTASTFFIPHLWDRTEIYEAYFTTHIDSDYLILDMRPNQISDSLRIAPDWEANGYTLSDLSTENIYIYTKE